MEWSYERSRGPKGPVVVAAAARPSIEARVADNGVLHLMGWRGGNCEIATKSGKTITTALPAPPNPLPIEGSWELVFSPGWGAPEKVTLPNLVSWPEHELEGVRYFSGAATYAKEFDLGQEWEARVREAKGTAPGGRLRTFLDLGRVEVLAEVALNGRNLRTLWKPPFRIEVSEDLKPGRNRLEIKVVNLWPNRLIGDEKIMGLGPLLEANKGKFPTKEWLKSTGRHTYMTSPQYKTDDPLLASGLLGPVVLESAVEMEITK
jgi:hypothetical protein